MEKDDCNRGGLHREDFPDPKRLSDRQLMKSLCTAIPQCMECDVDQCAYGREFRRRVRTGELGRRKKREDR